MTSTRDDILSLFSDIRAEWSTPQFASLFTPPPYLSKLENNRPTFLVGGRGTGKTTTLRSLRYDARQARALSSPVKEPGYYGIYVRINKNRVRAFSVTELDETARHKAFAHYFNILLCRELCQLSHWLELNKATAIRLNLEGVCTAFGIPVPHDARELEAQLGRLLVELELYVNNGGRTVAPTLSVSDVPLRLFAEELIRAGYLDGKLLFCCIDEYENLSEEQQSIVNTYIKHAEPPISYKVGLRQSGHKTRRTLDGDDQINDPDDFLLVEIAEEGFDSFAESVATHRLWLGRERGLLLPERLSEFLPDMPFDEEADALGCSRAAEKARAALKSAPSDIQAWAAALPNTRAYFLQYWHESSGEPVDRLALNWMESPTPWEVRLGNYGYASLFWLSRGRKGARIRKYYAGVSTLLAMASGNIRFFLELIDESIQIQIAQNWSAEQALVLSAKAQTEAARQVGKRRLTQLEGLSERGVEIKRLVLAIGKIFFEFARDPIGRAPEQNSFILSGEPAACDRISAILKEGTAHLAFEITPKTKATSQAEMRDDEYRLHPIFCAFFEFSHRRKRRVTLSANSLLKLSSSPSQAINELMNTGTQAPADELPAQLAMFTDFYQG
ncbi:hypothetical protein [Burkholderia orbicola]|uniref:ORC-CDC6 family AAA ATPase n=1 Tax=Burkholderia orbicola TaxID=2978683 RepID=UPI002FE13FBF